MNFFDEEKELILKAITDPDSREQLRVHLRAKTEEQAELLITNFKYDSIHKNKMIEAGLSAFDNAFNIYLKNSTHIQNPEILFSEYFGWFARQAMVKYIEENIES